MLPLTRKCLSLFYNLGHMYESPSPLVACKSLIPVCRQNLAKTNFKRNALAGIYSAAITNVNLGSTSNKDLASCVGIGSGLN